jgi:hypothetical protein
VAKMGEEKGDFAAGFMPSYSRGRIRLPWNQLQANWVAGGGRAGWSRRRAPMAPFF